MNSILETRIKRVETLIDIVRDLSSVEDQLKSIQRLREINKTSGLYFKFEISVNAYYLRYSGTSENFLSSVLSQTEVRILEERDKNQEKFHKLYKEILNEEP
ncbi:hypothetical protein AB3N60_16935 [Leptospira sp. WS39.C2]